LFKIVKKTIESGAKTIANWSRQAVLAPIGRKNSDCARDRNDQQNDQADALGGNVFGIIMGLALRFYRDRVCTAGGPSLDKRIMK